MLAYDVVGERQAETGTLIGGLGREEGIEDLVPHVRRNPLAIVLNADGDLIFLAPGGQPDAGHVTGIRIRVFLFFVGRMTGVVHHIQKHPGHFLRNDLYLTEVGIEVLVDFELKILIGSTGGVISQAGVFFQQGVHIRGLFLA